MATVSHAAITPTESSAAVARARAVFQGYRGVQITVRAAALTYISIFSLVPLAVVALVLLRAFGEEAFELRVERFVLRLVSPGVAEDTMAMLRGILNQASAKVAGLLGFATLIISAVPLVQNLDGSLNQVWNVKENRPYPIRVLVWLAAIIAGPVVLGVTLSATSLLHRLLVITGIPFRAELLSVMATVIAVGALTVLYVVTPNCKVHWRFALAGATVAGVLWSVARVVYSGFAAQTFRYGVLYGSLGALPLFLLWLYVSWLLVLFGARLAYALQTARRRSIWRSLAGHPRGRELAGVRVVQHLTRSWLDQERAPSRTAVAQEVELPEEVVQPVLEALRDAELVHEGKHSGWSPARDPAQLFLAEAIAALRGHELVAPTGPDPDLPSEDLAEVDALLAAADAEAASRLKKLTWVQLADLPSRAASPKS
jgi:membrane protein